MKIIIICLLFILMSGIVFGQSNATATDVSTSSTKEKALTSDQNSELDKLIENISQMSDAEFFNFLSSLGFSNESSNESIIDPIELPNNKPKTSIPYTDSPNKNNLKVNTKNQSISIMGQGKLSKKDMVNLLINKNKNLNRKSTEKLIDLYINESAYEGVNHDIAFAQMCYHTNFLSFDRTLLNPNSYNYCGFISPFPPNNLLRFNDKVTGVKAHIQHLKGYATKDKIKGKLVDPRYKILQDQKSLGSAPTLSELSNKWAGPDYAEKIRNILKMANKEY